jgi:glycosyltransferase involved in cell wall biosynthesis
MSSPQKNFVIVTPNLNLGEFLEDTIISVIKNLKPMDEYYIIDGGSTDKSLEIIRSYQKYLSGWVSESDKGYGDAISKGFSKTKANFMCWLNSSDLLQEGALDCARKVLQKKKYNFIYGDGLYIDSQNKIISVSNGNVFNLKQMMVAGWTPLQNSCFWTRELYVKVGGINTYLKYATDYDLFLRMSHFGNCKYVPQIFGSFRKHDGQVSLRGLFYEREKRKCKKLFIKEILNKKISFFIKIIFWAKVRFRLYFQQKKRKKHLVGINAKSVLCCKD